MIPIEDISGLDFSELDAMKLDGLLSGNRIIGAEPINYPATDGVIIYARDSQKREAAFLIEIDPESGEFSIKFSRLPQRH